MARYGVITDIPGNFEALAAALDHLEKHGVERMVCLGDVVGYNADGDRCVQMLRARGIDTIAGNHDLIAVGRLGTERCWYKAAHALRRTRQTLSDDSRRFLESLPATLSYEGCLQLIHGGLDDPTRYLRSASRVRHDALRLAAQNAAIRFCMFGHTHDPALYRVHVGGVDTGRVDVLEAEGERRLDASPHLLHFINPGSIDAARKRNYAHAELAVFDTDPPRIRFARVAYDAERSEWKARRAGYRPNLIEDLVYRTKKQAARLKPRSAARAADQR
jgi:predicted phosphodiesterase